MKSGNDGVSEFDADADTDLINGEVEGKASSNNESPESPDELKHELAELGVEIGTPDDENINTVLKGSTETN